MKQMKELLKETKYWWLIAINIIYPMMMTDKYFNITRTKVVTFELFVVFFTIAALYDELQSGIRNRKISNFKTIDYIVLSFLFLNVISAVTSDSWYHALFAVKDKNMGFFFVLALVCTYLIMRLEVWNMSVVSKVVGIGAILVTLFSMMQYLGLDLLWLLDGIQAKVAINFISPLGNTAVYGRFLILTYPVILSSVIFEENETPVLGILSAILFGPAVLVANVDAGWLGFFIIIWGFAVVAGKRLSTWVKCIRMYAYICVGLGIWGIIYLWMPDPRNTSRIARFSIEHWYIELLLAAILFGISVWLGKKEERRLIVGNVILGCGVGLAICIFGAFLYFSLWDRDTSLGGLENYIRFSKTWGTERGYIWNWCMELYQDFSWKEKLLGKGPGMVPVLLDNYYVQEMRKTIGYVFDNAHSLYLHFLLNIGLLGVLSYIGVIVCSVVNSWREKQYFGTGIALFACALIDCVCICEPITMPWTWIWVGMIASRTCK